MNVTAANETNPETFSPLNLGSIKERIRYHKSFILFTDMAPLC
jgi:hypothetical protein